MPYGSTDDLPTGVKNNLPTHAQEIYKSAYNTAYEEHESKSNGKNIAHMIAWAAVKQKYEKSEKGGWYEKNED